MQSASQHEVSLEPHLHALTRTLRGEVAAAFRAVLPRIAKLPADERDGRTLRTLRAVAFFGGKLTASEVKFLAPRRTDQGDYLANEGFMIPARGK